MSNFDIQSNPFLQSVSTAANKAKEEATESDELGQDAFLKLMIAQLENQDPLSPAENGEFIAQLAQFSSVEGITNLNNSVNGLVSEFRSSRALEASALVGRQVEINSNIAPLPEGGDLAGTVELPQSTDRLQIVVSTLGGEPVYVEERNQVFAGDVPFTWDGLNEDGDQLEAGTYRVQALALYDGEASEVPVKLSANVNSVSISAEDGVILNLEGVGSVPADSVSRYL